MAWKNIIPEWKNSGTEPSEELKNNGFQGGYKPPAGIFNWFWNLISKAINELQSIVTTISEAVTSLRESHSGLNTTVSNHTANKSNPHGVTAEQVGLGNVNNTKDSEKAVAFASEAGVGRKVEYPLTVRFKGGSTEGTDMFTYNGSTSRSVNITADKIGAAKNDLSNVDDDVFKEKVESNVVTGVPIVAATSTDGETYTATVEGITELYNGLEITIIPNMTSTKAAVQFDLNGLGAKNLRLKINGYNNGNSGTMAALAGWLGQDTPLTIRYISKFDNWQTVDFSRPSATGLYGTIKPTQGGTGISEETGITAGNFLVGNGTEPMLQKTPAEVLDLIGGAKIQISTYLGTGTYGDDYRNQFTFSFQPRVVFITCSVGGDGSNASVTLIPPNSSWGHSYSITRATATDTPTINTVITSESNKTVVWYSTDSALAQMNTSGKTYTIVGIG